MVLGKMKTPQISQLFPKPAWNRWGHIAFTILLVVATVAILSDIINDLEHNSWGLSARFTSRQIAAVFALKVFGLCLIGLEAIKSELFIVDQINMELLARSERALAQWVLIALFGFSVSFILLYADAFKTFGLIDSSDLSETHDPMIAVYFSLITWTTVGYGDFRPTEWARLFAATDALIGYVWMAVLIAVIARSYSRLVRLVVRRMG
jgi:hypothetical protein